MVFALINKCPSTRVSRSSETLDASSALPVADLSAAGDGVKGASNTPASSVQNMGVDHGSGHVAVAEQLLDGPDIVAMFKEVGGKGVSEGMAGGGLGDA